MLSFLGNVNPNSSGLATGGGKTRLAKQRSMTTLGNLVEDDFIVNDKLFATATPPQVMAASPQQQTVWVSYADGGLEVRNARTAEVIQRFSSEAAGSNGTRLSSGVARRSVFFSLGRGGEGGAPGSRLAGASESDRAARRLGGGAATSVALPTHVVHSMVTVPAVVDASSGGADGDGDVGSDGLCGGVESLWIGLSNGAIEVYNAVTNEFRFGLRKHVGPVYALAQFGGLVYSAGQDQRIVQWRVRDGRYVRFLHAAHGMHEGPVRCLHAEGNAVVSGSDDNTVKVWDAGSGELQLTGYFHSQSDGVRCLCPVGANMWSGDQRGQIVCWALHTCEAVRITQPHEAAVLTLRRVGARVYSGSADGTMGVLDSATGALLHKIEDQSRGWVTALAWPAQLSRFVVWSADTNGMVRCWYQDEYAAVTSDHETLSEPTWYLSGSTPYREFRASLVRRNAQLREQLAITEVRERSTMGLLRRCSRVFGGGGGAGQDGDIGFYTAKLKDQLRLAGERADKAERDLEKRKEEIAQLERDMAAALQVLQASRNELNMLSPGAVDRLAAILPMIPPEAYTSSGLEVPAPMPTAAVAPAAAAEGAVPPPPLPPPLPGAVVPLPGTLPTTAPPPPAPVMTAATLPVMAPLAVPEMGGAATTTSSSGMLPPPPPPPPLLGLGATGVPPPPLPGTGEMPPPPPPLTTTPLPAGPAGTVPPVGYDYYAQLGILPSAATLTSHLASSGMALRVPGTEAAADLTGAGAAGSRGGGGAAATLASGKAAVNDRLYTGAQWTNPNVGNYIQRRYYGASPGLRTTDLQKRERRRLRSPRVKVEPLNEVQRQRAGSRPSRSVSATASSSSQATKKTTTSTVEKSNTSTTVTKTTVTTSATAVPPSSTSAPPPPPPQ